MISAILIMAFYTTVVGLVFAYAFKAITGALMLNNAESAQKAFSSLAGGVWEPLLWQ